MLPVYIRHLLDVPMLPQRKLLSSIVLVPHGHPARGVLASSSSHFMFFRNGHFQRTGQRYLQFITGKNT